MVWHLEEYADSLCGGVKWEDWYHSHMGLLNEWADINWRSAYFRLDTGCKN